MVGWHHRLDELELVMDREACMLQSLGLQRELDTNEWQNWTTIQWFFIVSLSPIYLSNPEKAMAPHSSTLAWKIPWTEEPGGLQSTGSLSRTWLSDFTFTFHFPALEKEMATRYSVLAWRTPGAGEPGGLPSMGSHRVGHDSSDLAAAAARYFKMKSTTELHSIFFNRVCLLHWRRKWQPTPVFWPGESQERVSLVGCRLWGHTELDTTEAT